MKMETLESKALEVVKGKQTTNDYPYGGMRCTMTFHIEFKANKGYRYVSQSINPKTNRLNNPKASTYNHFMYMVKDSNGHFHSMGFNIRGIRDVEKFINLLTSNDFSFTEQESQYLWSVIISCIRVSLHYMKKKEDVTNDQVIESIAFKSMVKAFGAKADINTIKDLNINFESFYSLFAEKVY